MGILDFGKKKKTDDVFPNNEPMKNPFETVGGEDVTKTEPTVSQEPPKFPPSEPFSEVKSPSSPFKELPKESNELEDIKIQLKNMRIQLDNIIKTVEGMEKK